MYLRRVLISILLIGLSISIVIAKESAVWDVTTVCDADEKQSQQRVIAVGDGYSIIVWKDNRDGDIFPDIYAQKFDSYGNAQWDSNGVIVSIDSLPDMIPSLADDGTGGACVIWKTSSSPSVYVQRVKSNGDLAWTSGPAVMGLTSSVSAPDILSDGNEGAIAVWTGGDTNIYALRIDSEGDTLWGPTTICDASNDQTSPTIISDTSGGSIVIWHDKRYSGMEAIFAQKIDEDGESQWDEDGVLMYRSENAISAQDNEIVSDDSCGAIVLFHRISDNKDFIQRINSDGYCPWDTSGIPLPGIVSISTICGSGTSGVIFLWDPSNNGEIKGLKYNLSGAKVWETIVTQTDAVSIASLTSVSNGRNGVVFVYNIAIGGNLYHKIQMIDSEGDYLWGSGGYGVPISYNEHLHNHSSIAYDDDWGFIVAWNDEPGDDEDIFIRKFLQIPDVDSVYVVNPASFYNANGFLRGCPSGDWDSFAVRIDFDPNSIIKEIEETEITLEKPDSLFTFWSYEEISADTVVSDSAFAIVQHKHFSMKGLGETTLDCEDLDLEFRFKDVPLCTLSSFMVKSIDYNGDGTVNLSELSYLGLTYNKCEPVTGYNCWFDFNADDCVDLTEFSFLGEHYEHEKPDTFEDTILDFYLDESDVEVRIISEAIDSENKLLITLDLCNISDVSTLCLGIQYDAQKLIYSGWAQDEEFIGSSAVAPIVRGGGEELFIAGFGMENICAEEIGFVTLEFTGMKGIPQANEDLGISIKFGEVLYLNNQINRIRTYTTEKEEEQEDPIPIFVNRLENNYPNPFNPVTSIKYSIATDSRVNLTVYNVNGQRIRTLVDENQKRGSYSVEWDGKGSKGNAVSSGVYFYRIRTDTYSCSQKMILLR
jgi:hypothetical protein